MTKPLSHLAILIVLFVACAVSAQAQTVVNPRTVEFDPSADHSTLTPDNQPMVQRYDLQVFLVGAAQPMTTVGLGKPSPDADGKIRVDFSTLVAGWPLADGSYQARVAAVGPTGTAASDPSNTFAFQAAPPPCAYALSASSQAFGQSGGPGSVSVTCGSACSWTASSSAAWVILSATSGTGPGAVGYTVAKNSDPTARTATLTIGGQAYTITQAAANRPTAPKKVRVNTVVGS